MTTQDAVAVTGARRTWLVVLAAAAAVVALLLLAGWAGLLMPADKDKVDALGPLLEAIDRVRGPANAVFGSIAGLGVLAGGAMTAMGMPQGLRMMTMSGLSGGGVLLGNGIVA